MKIVIIDYGAGNVVSVLNALERLGVEAMVSYDAELIKAADKVIFPGVGQAEEAMKQLKEKGLVEVIVNLKQPVLGICLGMQLLCKSSEEGNVAGLGLFDVKVERFDNSLKVPQMGWNNLETTEGNLLKGLDGDDFCYFVHSYYVPLNKNTTAIANYGIPFSAAIEKDNFYGCQFHPEKSGEVGEQILRNFIAL
jgi:glutamine amidotransferase